MMKNALLVVSSCVALAVVARTAHAQVLTLSNASANSTALSATSSASNATAVVASATGGGHGVYGATNNTSYAGVYGYNSATTGNAYGVYGVSNSTAGSGAGIFGSGNSGVMGQGPAVGVLGNSTGGVGVEGTSTGGEGVYATSSTNNAIEAYNSGSGGSAVYAHCGTSGGYAIAGRNSVANNTGIAIYGDDTSTSGWSGLFTGRVYVGSTLVVNGTPEANQSTFSPISDARLKKNIEPLRDALNAILEFHGKTWQWKDPSARANQTGVISGFIAQDVEKVRPDWVIDDNGLKRISIPGQGLEALTVESIRELKVENDDLRIRSANLEDRVKSLEAGRRPLVSGLGERGIGLGLCAIAGAIVVATRRRRSDEVSG
jgi:hypothetical protein